MALPNYFWTRTPLTVSDAEMTTSGDYGVPIVVSDDDYRNFREAFCNNASIVQRPGQLDVVAQNNYPNPTGLIQGPVWGSSGSPMTVSYGNAVGATAGFAPDGSLPTNSAVRAVGNPTAGFWLAPFTGGGGSQTPGFLGTSGARPIAAGQTYYCRYWIRADVWAGYVAHTRAYFWKADGTWIGDFDIANYPSLPTAQWTLIQGSFVAPANAGWATFASRFDAAPASTALDFSVTGIMDGVGAPPKFVIGDYPNALWTGVRANSPSIMLDSRLVNQYPGPRAGGTWSQYHPDGLYTPTLNFADAPTGAPANMTSFRSQVTANSAGTGTLIVSPHGGDSASGVTDPRTMVQRGYQQVTPGGKFGVNVWAKNSSGTVNLSLNAYFRTADGSYLSSVASPTLVTNAVSGTWYNLKNAFTVPANAEWAMFWIVYARPSFTPPFTFDTRNAMPMSTATDPVDFFDGNSLPTAVWEGTPLLSASYRYA